MNSDGKVTISTALNNKGLEKDIKNISGSLGGLSKVVGKVALGITAAFGAVTIAISKQSVEAFADWQQLTGGVETLFKNSAEKVKKYAEDAFYTAGISANEYMETVTGVSASLISSLGGDTEKAADIANMAIIDMADNANKMGTPLENVKTAYAGFAKQQYQLLDNLKLGYGGTKTEMARLLKDAEAYSGVKYDINNLGDVYKAIHAIQEKLGVTGATAAEAEKTITGSANMTKAAWQDVLTAISGGGDLDKAINNLVYAISKYFENIVPVVEKSIAGIGRLIEKIGPQLVQTVAVSLIKAIPGLLNAVVQMIIGLAHGIYQGIAALLGGESVTTDISVQLNGVEDSASEATNAIYEIADATEAAGKAAKKSMAGFDQLNVLQAPDSDKNTAGTGIGADSIPNSSRGTVTVSATPKIQALIEKVKGFGEEIKTAFMPSISAWGEAFSGLGPSIESASSRIGTAWTTLKDTALVPFGEYITTDFIPSIVNDFSTTFAPIFADVMPVAIGTWTTDFENNCLLIQEYCSMLQLAFKGIKTVFSDMCKSISTNWDTYGGDLLQGFTDFKNGLWETWWYIYDNIINPVVTACGETLSWLWDEHLKPLRDGSVEFCLSVGRSVLALWNGYLKPVMDNIVKLFAPSVTNSIELMLEAVSLAIGWISDVIRVFQKYLDGFLQFIAGVFTHDWDLAWGGIRKIFEGVWSSFIGTGKSAFNAIIWALNQLIARIYAGVAGIVNGLGSIVDTVGDMLGQNWGFSIPTQAPRIPYLAQGAVLPPNKPFMAVVGDQKHGTNIEAPLSTIQEAVALVMRDFVDSNMAGHEATVAVLREILEAVLGIEIGDSVLSAAVDRYNRKMAIMKGG